jgi:hypothetical protein
MPSINSHKTPEQRAADQEACRRLAEALAAQPLSDRDRLMVFHSDLIDLLADPPRDLSAELMTHLTIAGGLLRAAILAAASRETGR